MSGNESLKPNQQKTIAALIEHGNISKAAEIVGVAERTVYRWMVDKTFRTALLDAEGEAIDMATRRLLSLAESAVNVLQGVLDDPKATTNNRIKAARSVLDYLLKMRELRNIEARLLELEAMLGKRY